MPRLAGIFGLLRRSSWLIAQAAFLILCPLLLWFETQMLFRRRRCRPNRIILVRHGESAGNVDKALYETTPDSMLPLTAAGFKQAQQAGKHIRALIGDQSARFFVSPYLRTRQTLLSILEAFSGQKVFLTAEPRLREQDFGNFQDTERMEQIYVERKKFGRFYYRFPNGEAGTDVYDRVAEFWSTLYRFMDQESRWERGQRMDNFVVVTHGLLMRIFCMCYFRWTVLEFEQVWNPSNCEIWVLERMRNGRYMLAGRLGEDGSFAPIRFGADKSQGVFEHMKQPLASREVVPGSADAFSSAMLAHLRIPGPPPELPADAAEPPGDAPLRSAT